MIFIKRNDPNQISKLIENGTELKHNFDNSLNMSNDNSSNLKSNLNYDNSILTESEYSIQKSLSFIEGENEDLINKSIISLRKVMNKSESNKNYTDEIHVPNKESLKESTLKNSFNKSIISNSYHNSRKENLDCYISPKKMNHIYTREEFITCKNEIDNIFNEYETKSSNIYNSLENSNYYNPRITTNCNEENNYESKKINQPMKFFDSSNNVEDNYSSYKFNFLNEKEINNTNLNNEYYAGESYNHMTKDNDKNTETNEENNDKKKYSNYMYISEYSEPR